MARGYCLENDILCFTHFVYTKYKQVSKTFLVDYVAESKYYKSNSVCHKGALKIIPSIYFHGDFENNE